VITHLNKDRRALNSLIHDARRENGETGKEEITLPVLVTSNIRDGELRKLSTWTAHKEAVALVDNVYHRISKVDKDNQLITLTDSEGKERFISPREASAEGVTLYRQEKMWELKRKLNAEAREQETAANTRGKYKPPAFSPLKAKPSRFVETKTMRLVRDLPSAKYERKPVAKHEILDLPDGWLEREAAAAVETERKKKMVAPMWNKGGYQYVGDDAPPEIIQGLGRKL
jgi:hypothetical protein